MARHEDRVDRRCRQVGCTAGPSVGAAATGPVTALHPSLALLQLADKRIDEQLDRVDQIDSGHGYLDARAVLRGNAEGGLVSARGEVGWRARDWLSLIAGGEVGYGWGSAGGLQYGIHIAGRGTW